MESENSAPALYSEETVERLKRILEHFKSVRTRAEEDISRYKRSKNVDKPPLNTDTSETMPHPPAQIVEVPFFGSVSYMTLPHCPTHLTSFSSTAPLQCTVIRYKIEATSACLSLIVEKHSIEKKARICSVLPSSSAGSTSMSTLSKRSSVLEVIADFMSSPNATIPELLLNLSSRSSSR